MLLVLDDESELAALIGDIATQIGFDARLVTSGHRFKEMVTTLPVQITIADLVMHDCDGLELVQFLAEHRPACGVVLMSEPDHRYLRAATTLASAWHVNLLGTLTKPIRAADLIAVLRAALARTGGPLPREAAPSPHRREDAAQPAA